MTESAESAKAGGNNCRWVEEVGGQKSSVSNSLNTQTNPFNGFFTSGKYLFGSGKYLFGSGKHLVGSGKQGNGSGKHLFGSGK